MTTNRDEAMALVKNLTGYVDLNSVDLIERLLDQAEQRGRESYLKQETNGLIDAKIRSLEQDLKLLSDRNEELWVNKVRLIDDLALAKEKLTEQGALYAKAKKLEKDLMLQREVLVEALKKIADPRLRDHTEPDAYTELGCVMNMAEEALEKIGIE
jgi:hypothetical protein